MPTTVIKTIKPAGGGDFASINSWESSRRADIVSGDRIEVAEVYSGGNANTTVVTISTGWTTDSTRYIEIRAAVGHAHLGVFSTGKAYWSSNGYCLKTNQEVRVKQLQWTSTGDDFTLTWPSPAAGKTVTFDSCVVLNPAGGSANACFYLASDIGDGSGTVNIRSCTVISRRSPCKFVRSNATGVVNVYNCTYRGTHGLSEDDGTINEDNNYLSCTTTTYTGTITKGNNTATSDTSAATVALRSIAYSTANFNVVTSGSEDLHITKTSGLRTQGTNLFSSGVTLDIDGQDRPSGGTFDIGADEIPPFATIIKSIKAAGGGDYTDLASWITARKGNLVIRNTLEVAEIYGGGSVGNLMLLNGDWTVDSTNYIHVRAALGEEHEGIFDSNKAYIQAVSEDIGIGIEKGFTQVGPGICVESQGAPGTFIYIDVIVGDAPVTLDSLIVKDNSNDDMVQISTHNSTALPHIVKNCVMYKQANKTTSIVTSQSQANTKVLVYNCTLICGTGGWALYAPAGTITSENCYLKAGAEAYSDGGSGTIVKGNNDATSNGDASDPSLRNITHSISNFKNVTFATADYHIIGSSQLKDAGVDLSGSGVTLDFVGIDRPQGNAFDIGAHEIEPVPGGALFLGAW